MRLSSVIIFMLVISSLHAQTKEADEKWIGFNNLFFKNKDINTITPSTTNTNIWHEELLDNQFSIGVFFRKINEKKVYKQFDLFEIGWNKNKDYRTVESSPGDFQIIGGKEIKAFNVLVGYQQGKLFPIRPKLYGDIGVRGTAWYKTIDETPFNSTGYPLSVKSVGLGLNLELGLNYQVHKRINIGYNFVPVTFRVFWNEDYVDNPILPIKQKTDRSIKFRNDFFDSIIGVRNFHVSYVF